jgi:hypothetical protein
MIFDSLVADFDGEISDGAKSANIELCVISSVAAPVVQQLGLDKFL